MLQCMLNCHPLTNYCLNMKVGVYTSVVQEYWKGDTNVVNPIQLLSRFKQFRGGTQQDAHEAYLAVIEYIHKKTRCDKRNSPYYKLADTSSDAYKQWYLETPSIVVDLFTGQLQVDVKDTHYETFRSLELSPTCQISTVDALIFDYFKNEQTSDTKMNIKRSIHYAPLCLVMSFKQFFRKSTIKFKETLDLSWYMSKKHKCPHKPMYRLCGIVLHGGDRHGGHYISATKCLGKWYLNNDSHTRKINISEVNENSIYMLFYTLNNSSSLISS